MLNLVIPALLGLLCRSLQTGKQSLFLDRLHVLSRRKSVRPKIGTIVLGEALWIRDEPRFNHLNDEMALFGHGLPGFPSIPVPQVVPGCLRNTGFGINEKDIERGRMGLESGLELVECNAAGSTRDDIPVDPPLSRQVSQGFQEIRESRPHNCPRIDPLASSLDIDPDFLHHRLPPTSPILQTSPSLYSFNQLSRWVSSKRLSCVPFLCFPQTTTASGIPDNAETSVSE